MDLLQTVRKEGSRGGRSEFSWSDVQNDAHRQNYLGHSLMAPVGRWQKGKDLNWYARGEDDKEKGPSEEELRREEMRKIKEQEQDEMLRALGMPVPDRENANLEPVRERLGSGIKGTDEPISIAFGEKPVQGPSGGPRRSRSRSRDRRHRRDDHGSKSHERRHRRDDNRSRSRERRHRKDDDRSRSRQRRHRRDDRRTSRSRDGDREKRHTSHREDKDRERRHRHRHGEHRSRSGAAERTRHRSRSRDERRDRDHERRRSYD